MRGPGWLRSLWMARGANPASANATRDRFAQHLAIATVVVLCPVFIFSKGTQFLMPGPLTSAHGAIEKCGTCHTQSGSGKVGWVHGLIAGDPLADSKACLTCHKMPDTAFNAHGAPADVLKQSTERLTKIAATTPQPPSARAQRIAFPTHDIVERGMYCATCHQEHQGVNFSLKKISNEQCRSCHVVKFDSFKGGHPKFDNYPFKRRTGIIYDHAGHFGKHYPEVAKKQPDKRIPATCSTCHNSHDDKRVMAVAPFDQTCTGCHLDQIVGKERVSGPKGIAFLSLPGLDLETLKTKKAAIGEWPEASEAELTPFMKVMISRNARGRAMIKALSGVNLQDLSGASDDQIKAVTSLVWEIKRLFHALISGKASDVLADLSVDGGEKLPASVVADLTASIPRDVITSAQQQWLPNLSAEVANRKDAMAPQQSGSRSVLTEVRLAGSAFVVAPSVSVTRKESPAFDTQGAGRDTAGGFEPLRLAQAAGPEPAQTSESSKFNQGDEAQPADDGVGGSIVRRRSLPSGTPRSIKARSEGDGSGAKPKASGGKVDGASEKTGGGKDALPADEKTEAMKAGGDASETSPKPEGAAGAPDPATTKADDGKDEPANQSDDLLSLSDEEQREVKAREKGGKPLAGSEKADVAAPKTDGAAPYGSAAKTEADAPTEAPAKSTSSPTEPAARAAPAMSVESDVDPESWAEYGGWYRQDYAIFYRPIGHKDKFVYSWLTLTGPHAPRGDKSPASAVFDFLTSKDAQGSCTKCHSVDDIAGKGRVVNFSPLTFERKRGRFTTFIHEPHFGVLETRGCLTCHALEKERPYLKSYEQGDPQNFASSFGEVKKDLCQTCHTKGMARQDCLTCHTYHVNGVVTPIMTTKIPTE